MTSRAAARPYALAVSWPVASSMLQVPACCRHLERRSSRPSSTSVIRRPFLMPRLAMDSAGAVLIAEPQFPTSNFQTCSLTDLGKLTFALSNCQFPASSFHRSRKGTGLICSMMTLPEAFSGGSPTHQFPTTLGSSPYSHRRLGCPQIPSSGMRISVLSQ